MSRRLSLSILALIAIGFCSYALACTSRSVPKPRPSHHSSISGSYHHSTRWSITTTTTTTTTTPRPNITFPTYKCPATYDAWYCLNDATCFSVKIGDSIMYNCECAIGFMGPRCEYKELDGSYLPQRPRPILEKASIASGAFCALLFMLFICLTLYLRYDQRAKTALDNAALDANVHEELRNNGSSSYCLSKSESISSLRCRFCNDKRCCGDAADLLANAKLAIGNGAVAGGKYRGRAGFNYRQHIEAIPLYFNMKRTSKI